MWTPDPYADHGNRLLAAIALIAVTGATVWLLREPSFDFSRWHADLEGAKSAAHRSGKPIFVYFSADWCGPCREFRRSTLADPAVAQELEANWERAVIDLSDRNGPNNAVAADELVQAIPAMILLDAHGRRLGMTEGAMRSADLLAWLNANRPKK